MVKEGLIAKHNYKRATDAIHDLEEHTKKCSLETPQMSGVPVKFIERAFYNEEIGEQDRNTLLDRVATANNNFLRDCGYKNLSLISIR